MTQYQTITNPMSHDPRKVILAANTDWYLYNFRLALAKFLRQQGQEVVLASPDGPHRPLLEQAGFRWIHWPVGRRTFSPVRELAVLRALATIYRRERPDLVHHFTVKPVIYGSLAARLARVPAVVNSVTGLGYVFLASGPGGALLRAVVRVGYRMAFAQPNLAIIFENEADRETFQAMGLLKKQPNRVIQGVGVDVERFKAQPDPGPDGLPLAVFPSRMLLDKGLGELIEAARQLKPLGVLRIALVGEPDPGNPATVSQEQLLAWQAEGLVEWWGFRSDMDEVYRQANIITLPSHGEGLPTVLIEAAASSRPIVTTDVAGCRDVVIAGHNGLLVPAGDAAALARALRQLAGDREARQRMGQAGRELALQRFTSQRVNSETLALYQALF